jgi:hypothetical protein
MRLSKAVTSVMLLTMSLISTFVVAQCPYTQPTFTKNQVSQLCSAQKKQEDLNNAFSKALGKVKVDMLTVKANTQHHVGNIYAVLVGGVPTSTTGGSLVPILPPPVNTSDQSVAIGSGAGTCNVTLHFNSAQDYFVINGCPFPIKVVAIFSDNPVVPLD